MRFGFDPASPTPDDGVLGFRELARASADLIRATWTHLPDVADTPAHGPWAYAHHIPSAWRAVELIDDLSDALARRFDKHLAADADAERALDRLRVVADRVEVRGQYEHLPGYLWRLTGRRSPRGQFSPDDQEARAEWVRLRDRTRRYVAAAGPGCELSDKFEDGPIRSQLFAEAATAIRGALEPADQRPRPRRTRKVFRTTAVRQAVTRPVFNLIYGVFGVGAAVCDPRMSEWQGYRYVAMVRGGLWQLRLVLLDTARRSRLPMIELARALDISPPAMRKRELAALAWQDEEALVPWDASAPSDVVPAAPLDDYIAELASFASEPASIDDLYHLSSPPTDELPVDFDAVQRWVDWYSMDAPEDPVGWSR